LIAKLLNWVITTYYSHLLPTDAVFSAITESQKQEIYAAFYTELVEKVAQLAAQWMTAGFCHAVLNTDNMAITAESFDYGPFDFIETYNPKFTAAYFDYYGRYCYANQPAACQWNLEMLQYPLKMVMSGTDLEAVTGTFGDRYRTFYINGMLKRLGLIEFPEAEDLVISLLRFLAISQISYHDFFMQLRIQFHFTWRDDRSKILADVAWQLTDETSELLSQWRSLYHHYLIRLPIATMEEIGTRLIQSNPTTILRRSQIETVWERITQVDDWRPFYQLVAQLQAQ
jgi:serine/tyrosine/threonine adenylyltransferase